ncbi:MAG: phosphatidate cytidylyltransferase [Bryobacter sp.]|nr:phosphatidate cytidylyltransferase [Bryobacter sp.]
MKRLLTAAWLIPFGYSSIFLSPQPIFVFIVAVLALLCYREYVRLVQHQGLAAFPLPGAVLGVLLLVRPNLAWTDFLVLSIVALGLSLRSVDGEHGFRGSFASAAAFTLGILYIFTAWRAAIGLRALSPHWLFFGVALNWAGDAAAYYFGRAFGKRRLAPLISPNKSCEGALASLAASVLFGCIYLPQVLPPLSLPAAALLALAGNVAGQLGDLAESALKRAANQKDSGTMLSGHGGWLDRLDSSLFSMPTVYWLLYSFGLAP